MLVSYMGAQPQKLPEEHQNKTETELNDLGFTICPEKPTIIPGQKTIWANNTWTIVDPNSAELSIQWQKIKDEVDRLLKESDQDIVLSYEKNKSVDASILQYRDNLRTVLKSSNPFDISWPEKPVIETTIIDEVKAEAARRILEICPEWKQRNLTAQAAILAKKGEANWSPEEAAAWSAGEQIWAQIALIRAKSDALEAMSEIPADFKNDSYWV